MELQIRTRGVELTPTLQDLIDRRVRFALARFAQLLANVECTLADVNGPKGGVDKVCKVKVKARGARPLVIEQADSTIERAIDVAVERAARSVARELKRARTTRARRSGGRGRAQDGATKASAKEAQP